MVIKVEPMLLSLLIVSKMSTFKLGQYLFFPRNFGNGSEARRPRDFWMSKQKCESMGAFRVTIRPERGEDAPGREWEEMSLILRGVGTRDGENYLAVFRLLVRVLHENLYNKCPFSA